jgi:hypothetical protein
MRQPELLERAKRELSGRILGCWCAPKACHGDVLAEIANVEEAASDDPDVVVQVEGVDYKGRPFCAGIVIRGDECVETAPILYRTCRGKSRAEVRLALKAKGWKARLAAL